MASNVPAACDVGDTSFQSSGSNPDSSTLSLESSFRLDPAYTSEGVECDKHPKGKRKRTTTQDKAILESAYNANPKPDKAARLDIVKRVTLNEKEVQIWFQNRRQNDRRKSRPLSPQEIAALRYGGAMQPMSAEPVHFGPQPIMEQPCETRGARGEVGMGAAFVNQPSTPAHIAPRRISQPSPLQVQGSRLTPNGLPKSERSGSESDTLPSSQKSEPEGDSQALSYSLSNSIGYLSNRWNFGNSFSSTPARTGEDPFRRDSFQSSVSPTTQSSPGGILPPPSSSQVRLSLSLEGKAELVSSQPSPPQPGQPPLPADADTLPPVRTHRILHRSRSALAGITLPPISTLTAHLPPQLKHGRSRDVHAWESCCEADTRDELTKQAENESSGSAVAAISLLRSSSSSSSLNSLLNNDGCSGVVRSSTTKRNAAPVPRTSAKKAKLSRASSSVARMQTVPPLTMERDANVTIETPEPAKKSHRAGVVSLLSPSGDSDKENWSPEENGNGHRRRLLPEVPAKAVDVAAGDNLRRMGRVLGEQSGLFKRANTSPMPRQKNAKHAGSPLMIFEDGEKGSREGTPNEVERFMRGEVSPSKKPDMDCIAGLLSLSQGNWR
ncbi:hypothetical protein SLS62_002773 [Diatrype stigma]|uniref:Homeobox domain-containing protein n=1 Tax=Diatrype stigma TaxID=117547 RepID=A0AAN9YQI9_9PEZI